MGDGDAARRRRGSAAPSQRQREPAEDTDETETTSSGEVARADRDEIKQQDNQSSDAWHHRLQSGGSLSASTPTHRRPRVGVEVVRSLDELTEMSSIAAVVALQRWWRRHSGSGQRVAFLQKLCRRHVLELVRRRRTAHARSKLHAIALQIIFLGVFSFSILHGYSHDRLYRFTRAVTSQYLEAPFSASTLGAFKTYCDIASAQELFEWLRGPFVSTTYSNGSLASSSPRSNRIIGGIRIGQLRVEKYNCSSRVTPFFSWTEQDDDTYSCYGSGEGDFELSTEEDDPIQVSNGDAYVFQGLNGTDTDTERSAFFSTMSVLSAQYSLPAPAFSVVLPRANGVQASSIFEALENNGYIDGQTRAVMLDLSVYNIMLRHVAALRLLVEFPASGGAIASLRGGVAPLTSSLLLDADHWMISACHLVVVLFYGYLFLDEVLALARSHSRQWQYQAVWHRSSLKRSKAEGKRRPSPLHRRHGTGVRLLGLLCYAVTWLLRLVAMVKRPSELPLDSDKFVPLRPYVETFRAAQLALSACACLAWIELLLMLRVSLIVDLIVRAVVCAAPQLFVLIVMVAMVVMGYASACLIVLGAESSLFQSLPEALRSLLSILLQTGTGAATGTTGASSLLGFSSLSTGDVGHDAAGTSTLRTLLLACFLLLNVLVATNLFLVIVYEGYLRAKHEIEVDRHQVHPPQCATKFLARYGDDDERIEAAPMHLDLRREIIEYAKVIVSKLVSLIPIRLKLIVNRRKAAEMQSTVLPGDAKSPALKQPSERDESEDEQRGDHSPSSARGRVKAKYTRGATYPRDYYQGYNRSGTRERSSGSTKLLEGMVLQLALQNETLLRAVNELKQDVKALQRGGDVNTSDRDVLRRGSVAQSTPIRSHKQRKTSAAAVGSTLVTIPDAPNNQIL